MVLYMEPAAYMLVLAVVAVSLCWLYTGLDKWKSLRPAHTLQTLRCCPRATITAADCSANPLLLACRKRCALSMIL